LLQQYRSGKKIRAIAQSNLTKSEKAPEVLLASKETDLGNLEKALKELAVHIEKVEDAQ